VEALVSVFDRGLLFAEDTGDQFAVDDPELSASTEFEGIGRDPIDVAEAAVGFLMQEGNGVGGEDLSGVQFPIC
jgi:hypothetical protein